MIQGYWDRTNKHVDVAKRIADDAEQLAERLRVNDTFRAESFKVYSEGGTINQTDNEYVKVLEQLREVLRVPEGENIVTHAKVVRALADALIGIYPGMK